MLTHLTEIRSHRPSRAGARCALVFCGLALIFGGCARTEETGQPAGPSYWVSLSYHAPNQEGVWLNISASGRFEALGLGPHLYQGSLLDEDRELLLERTSATLIDIYKLDALPSDKEAALSDDDAWHWIQVSRQAAPFGTQLSAIFDDRSVHPETIAFLQDIDDLFERYSTPEGLGSGSTRDSGQ